MNSAAAMLNGVAISRAKRLIRIDPTMKIAAPTAPPLP
jgi:hypothetical protein